MTRSPTETLIAAMEEAEDAKECLVVLTTKDGYILTLGSTDQRVLRIGMLETAKQWIVADMLSDSVKEG
jgi:hypothetical protein